MQRIVKPLVGALTAWREQLGGSVTTWRTNTNAAALAGHGAGWWIRGHGRSGQERVVALMAVPRSSEVINHVACRGVMQIVRKILQLGTYLAHTDFLQKGR